MPVNGLILQLSRCAYMLGDYGFCGPSLWYGISVGRQASVICSSLRLSPWIALSMTCLLLSFSTAWARHLVSDLAHYEMVHMECSAFWGYCTVSGSRWGALIPFYKFFFHATSDLELHVYPRVVCCCWDAIHIEILMMQLHRCFTVMEFCHETCVGRF